MKSVIVIGGGVIGLCIAERLVHEGFAVTLIERDRIAAGASYGNAAGFAFPEIMPLASTATMRKAVKWFLDPLGSFTVVPQDLPATLGWLTRFALAARKPVFERSRATLAALMQLEHQTLPLTHQRTGLGKMIRLLGALHVYENRAQYQRDLENWRFREQHGIQFEALEGEALHDFQPGLAKQVVAGIFAPDYPSVTNPYEYCTALHHFNQEQGIRCHYAQVVDVKPAEQGVTVSLQGGDVLTADKVVIAAGAWSAQLADKLGDKVPLIGERGYNTTLPESAFPELKCTLFFAEHGFVMAPLENAVRVGGASEIASLQRPPNYRRSANMLAKAKQLVPGLGMEGGEQWMGHRPTLPDTLPVISPATVSPDVIYAFGHGHLGLTLASSTAQLVLELIQQREPSIDVSALRVRRF
ncbi:MAG: FAD-binding oxidoreductase [Thiolinea sp.]